MVGFREVLGGAVAGLGEGLIQEAEQRRREATAALERQQRTEERMQDRAWEVEDRDLAMTNAMRLKSMSGGRGRGGGSGGGGSSGAPPGLVVNEDGTLSLSGRAPADTTNRFYEAMGVAAEQGRDAPTWADWNAIGGSSIDPVKRADMIAKEVENLRQSIGGMSLSADQIEAQAARNIDKRLGTYKAPTPQPTPAMPAEPSGFGAPAAPAPSGPRQAPARPSAGASYPPAPRDPAQREVGAIYTAPDGRTVRWTGQNWELMNG